MTPSRYQAHAATPCVSLAALRPNSRTNFTLSPGEAKLSPGIYGLIGENGAGKTTLLAAMSGEAGYFTGPGSPTSVALARTGADVRFVGRTIKDHLRAAQFAYPKFDIDAALRGIDKPANSRLARLSVGGRQQVSNVTALHSGCAMILLDEPFSGLDSAHRIELRDAILELAAVREEEDEAVIVVTSQYATDLAGLAELLIPIDKGVVGGPIELDEAREQFPIVRGPADAVDQIASGYTVLDEKSLGAHKVVVLRGRLSPSGAAYAESRGVLVDLHGDAELINLLTHIDRRS